MYEDMEVNIHPPKDEKYAITLLRPTCALPSVCEAPNPPIAASHNYHFNPASNLRMLSKKISSQIFFFLRVCDDRVVGVSALRVCRPKNWRILGG